ncbi:Cytochrome P450 76A2 [Acorus gramineus]|uniref:Cytochrome P450 76A2 n=1 Tax=Acorus gramineus TaxID=55184 RepID=A0AAV9BIX2_ACOGR|nr:Cytochrome P450 76A2 [Acorus gramineus]
MGWGNWLLWLSLCLSAATMFLWRKRDYKTRKTCSRRLPPGPRVWPLVGNLLDLGFNSPPHQTLALLSQKYGPLMWLKLGAVDTVVVSSSEAATSLFKENDMSFVGRAINEAMRSHDYDKGSLVVAQYGPRWQMLRRLCVSELIHTKQLNETMPVRMKCVDDMIRWIKEETGSIEVAQYVFMAIFNMMGNVILSRDLVEPKSELGAKFFCSMRGLIELMGIPNVSDFFPFLRWLDPQGIKGKVDQEVGRALEIVDGFIKERIQSRCSGQSDNRRKDFLDVVLEFESGKEESQDVSGNGLKIFILEIFMAATDTTNSTIEWAMVELLRNPATMHKAQVELIEVVGQKRKVEESAIDRLHYLKAVAKETMRLHPPVPLLIPRRAVKDVEFMGYFIPKDTQLLVHAWALGREPMRWDDPLSFKPERFSNVDLDYHGQHFQFIPFGAGRRMCAGVALAERLVLFILGSLIHSFDWVFDGAPESMDMGEKIGVSLRKSVPLKATPVPHNA